MTRRKIALGERLQMTVLIAIVMIGVATMLVALAVFMTELVDSYGGAVVMAAGFGLIVLALISWLLSGRVK